MAQTAANVRVAVAGGFYFAPLGSTLPTDASTPLDPTFKEVGYLTEDGTVMSFGETNTDIKAWQNAQVVRRLLTEQVVTFALSLMETNVRSLELWSGAAVTTKFEIKAGVAPHKSFILEVIDGTNVIRIVIPDGQVTEHGDVNFVNADAIAYPITITTYPDPTTGVKAIGYMSGTIPAMAEGGTPQSFDGFPDPDANTPTTLVDEQLVDAPA